VTPRHTWHIVSGKGGTGKTTIAGGLACALATNGRRVLICEVEGRQGIAELFDVPPLTGAEERRISRTPAGGTVYGLAIDAQDALMEYLDTFYHLSIAGKALDRFGAVDFATSIAPGLRDVLLTGKVYEAVRRKIKNRPNAYDAVVLDAPPTGRIAQFLNVHAAVAGLAKVGPIRNQADSIMRLLRSATTTVHLVTLLEDMPVTETEEAAAALRPTQIRIGTVIENMVTPTPLNDDQLQAAAAGSVILKVPGLTVKQNKALATEFRLAALGLPLVQIAFDHEGIDEGAIFAIAEQLTDQMNLEAA
jgi:anion-transporting  ArsA/GET3 family ATPase